MDLSSFMICSAPSTSKAFAKNCKGKIRKENSVYMMFMALGSLVLHDFSCFFFSEIVRAEEITVKASLFYVNQDTANILLVRIIFNYMLKQHGFNLQHRRIFITILLYTNKFSFYFNSYYLVRYWIPVHDSKCAVLFFHLRQ